MFPVLNDSSIEKSYGNAREVYAQYGVDTEAAMKKLAAIAISFHCWQGDDVGGFEGQTSFEGSGIAATGNYPGKPRTADELRADLDKALSLVPGTHRLNLQASYGDFAGKNVDRNEYQPEFYTAWIDWAKSKGMGLDFNPTCFGHPKASTSFTLSHSDSGIRQFWVEHCIASRKIGAHMGKSLGTPCVTNIWIPDGFKDIPVDRMAARKRLANSLDAVLAEKIDPAYNLDAVESKLFGIASESCVIGSHEFYMGYALRNNILVCYDIGHFHPTEVVSDKISSTLLFLNEILLHFSRGVRWDSDHVLTYTDEVRAITEEIVRNDFLNRVHISLDFFDASINRVAAWVIGSRALLKALLHALLEPTPMLRKLEEDGDNTSRLAMLEEVKALPMSSIWDYYCMRQNVPVGAAWLNEIKQYETDVLFKRS